MTLIHGRDARGRTRTGWLDSAHTFSFGGFHDPARMGFRRLRVINDDRVIPGAGFPTHGHADMDIVTYVISGALAHRDSIGNGSVIRAGDMQRMSAGSGIQHSEMNASTTEPVRFLQIWLLPDRRGGAPVYEQQTIDDAHVRNRFGLVAGGDGSAGIRLLSDTAIRLARLDAGAAVSHDTAAARASFLHVVSGRIGVDGEPLGAGDGLATEAAARLRVRADTASEVLLFDLGA